MRERRGRIMRIPSLREEALRAGQPNRPRGGNSGLVPDAWINERPTAAGHIVGEGGQADHGDGRAEQPTRAHATIEARGRCQPRLCRGPREVKASSRQRAAPLRWPPRSLMSIAALPAPPAPRSCLGAYRPAERPHRKLLQRLRLITDPQVRAAA
jgi:hypothetical protein